MNPDQRQLIQAAGGVAYGAVGGSVHNHGPAVPPLVFADRPPAVPPTRHGGPAAKDLRIWLADTRTPAVRWLYGAAGSGKTALADRLAARARKRRWRVVEPAAGDITAGPGEPSPAGLLAIIGDAGSRSLTDLIWLLSNAILYQPRPTRVLLIARDLTRWPVVRAALAGRGVWTDTQQVNR
ncbi:hypothetical protein GCM10010112_63230 [Actinoplanes lobatus]|nr:hypothetical protein GCM10010112_63230 [Actinoplanes lobatus]GIE44101.1 hypothetical protein Alo02nite_69990 [Actinoplanes lobatus]